MDCFRKLISQKFELSYGVLIGFVRFLKEKNVDSKFQNLPTEKSTLTDSDLFSMQKPKIELNNGSIKLFPKQPAFESEYPEYAGGSAGALLGLYFVRYRGYVDHDLKGLYGGELIWADGTPSQEDFTPLFDITFDPQLNKSSCYHFMTWITVRNDC